MLTNQKHKFSLPQDLIYFNVAYMSPLLKIAELVGIEGLMKKKNPMLVGMGHFFDNVEKLKSTFGKIIHADAKQIAIIPSVSYGIANAAKNIQYKTNGELVLLDEQFPSNYYPWQRAAKENNQTIQFVKPGNEQSTRVVSWNENIISKINPNTSAVCMPHVHWADGSLYDLKRISAACQANNAYLILDATQSVGALPLYLDEVHFDALVVGGYKWLLGHYGLGMAYYSEKFNDGIPIEENWINKKDSDNFQALVNYTDQYREGAAQYSVGEQSNFVHVPMLQAGMEQILEWGVENIQSYCRILHEKLISELADTPYIVPNISQSSSHLTSIRITSDMDMEKIKQTLTDNNVFVSYRGDAMRVSFYVFNTEAEVKRMASILKTIL